MPWTGRGHDLSDLELTRKEIGSIRRLLWDVAGKVLKQDVPDHDSQEEVEKPRQKIVWCQ